MPRAAVLGSPIEHSLSPLLHNAGYTAAGLKDWSYTRFEITDETLPAFLEQAPADFRGFSVTMPGKFAALALGDVATDRARLIGSANTLVRTPQGWLADNTDADGVLGALGELLGDASIEHATIIGAGGTARPALWGLARFGAQTVTVLNRSDRLQELEPLAAILGVELRGMSFDDDLSDLSRSSDVVVSTVPSRALEGHLPELSHAPVFDVIYDPWPTPLTIFAAADGYKTVGGQVMLAHQAFSQFELFTGRPAPRAAMFEALNAELALRSASK
ncbi:shikimate dehydrogenase [Corynebacterium flavescens]